MPNPTHENATPKKQPQLWSPGNPGQRITVLTDHDGRYPPFSHCPAQARPGSSVWVLVLVPRLGMYEQVHLRVLSTSGNKGLGEVEASPQHCGLKNGNQVEFRVEEVYNFVVVD